MKKTLLIFLTAISLQVNANSNFTLNKVDNSCTPWDRKAVSLEFKNNEEKIFVNLCKFKNSKSFSLVNNSNSKKDGTISINNNKNIFNAYIEFENENINNIKPNDLITGTVYIIYKEDYNPQNTKIEKQTIKFNYLIKNTTQQFCG